MILTNVPQGHIIAIAEPNAKIPAAHTSVNAAMDFKVSPLLYAHFRRTSVLFFCDVQFRQTFQATVKANEDVEILTSAKMMFAKLDHGVLIQEEATDAMISMNVPMEHISVIQMHSVEMPMMVILVLATTVTEVR